MKYNRAIILINWKKRKEVMKLIDDKITEEIIIKKIIRKRAIIYSCTEFKNKFVVMNLKNIWIHYSYFDDFLLRLASEKGFNNLNNKGFVIGHLDKFGFLWTDYSKNY